MATIRRVWRLKPALAQGAVVRTNSRDTIYQAKISPACDELALCHFEALQATTSRAVYSTITGKRLVRIEGAGGLIRPRSKPISYDLLSGGHAGNLVVLKEGTHVKGRGCTPPILHYRHAALVGPHN